MTEFNQRECYVHTPYILNLASPEKRIADNSVRIIREEMERGSFIGAKYVLSHLGSAKDAPMEDALEATAERLKIILDGDFSSQFLIEISAGAGNIIGSKFEELAYFLNDLKDFNIGVCFDTAHAFESGYDLRTKESSEKVFDAFDRVVGLDNLKLFHFNDSKTDFGSRKDRHEHIGKGKIGIEGFGAIARNKRLAHINGVIETPFQNSVDGGVDNLGVLRGLRTQ